MKNQEEKLRLIKRILEIEARQIMIMNKLDHLKEEMQQLLEEQELIIKNLELLEK